MARTGRSKPSDGTLDAGHGSAQQRGPRPGRGPGVWQPFDHRGILLPPARSRLRGRTGIECGCRRRVQDRRLSRADANRPSPPPDLKRDRTDSQGRTTWGTGVTRRTDQLAGHGLSIPRFRTGDRRRLCRGRRALVFGIGDAGRGLSDRPERPSRRAEAPPGVAPGRRSHAETRVRPTIAPTPSVHRRTTGNREPSVYFYHPDASDGGR